MNGRQGVEGQGAEVDILYERANERVAKAVAFLGSYLIWGVLGLLAAAVGLLSL